MVEGLVIVPSRNGAKETMNRLATAVSQSGMTVVARIDHASAAEGVGLSLRPTEVLVFGNPKAGTPLMQAAQTLGVDLPLKALVWEDEAGNIKLAYDDPVWLAKRHGVDVETHPVLGAMADALAAVARQATA